MTYDETVAILREHGWTEDNDLNWEPASSRKRKAFSRKVFGMIPKNIIFVTADGEPHQREGNENAIVSMERSLLHDMMEHCA